MRKNPLRIIGLISLLVLLVAKLNHSVDQEMVSTVIFILVAEEVLPWLLKKFPGWFN